MTYHTTVSIDLVTVTCWCGTPLAVPRGMREHQQRQHDDGREQDEIHCPHGHGFIIAGKSAAEKLRDSLDRERASHDQTRTELRETENRRRAEKAAKTRIKNRVAAGVCPCCHRTFQNLARHMKMQHKEFAKE